MDGCLTLDIGNTNASLAFVSFVDGDPSGWRASPFSVDILGGWSRNEDEAERMAAGLLRLRESHGLEAGVPKGLRAGISAVGSKAREHFFIDQLGALGWSIAIRPDAGLVLEIRCPETCGSDRQYAMRAALEDGWRRRTESSAGGAVKPVHVLVVDAGTALTVDAGALRPNEQGDRGAELVFLGGAIALGPGALGEAITARGARLAEFEVDPDAPALGRSTVDALRAGVSVGFRGAVRELMGAVSAEAFGGTQGVLVYLTGGARAFARAAVAETFPAGFHESAHLVHTGLAHAVRSAPKNA